jgi:hypothetical protein
VAGRWAAAERRVRSDLEGLEKAPNCSTCHILCALYGAATPRQLTDEVNSTRHPDSRLHTGRAVFRRITLPAALRPLFSADEPAKRCGKSPKSLLKKRSREVMKKAVEKLCK